MRRVSNDTLHVFRFVLARFVLARFILLRPTASAVSLIDNSTRKDDT
ncbi:MAG TPA: hypothetical protein VF656_08530 [Pyrinomonadaceae bacterium]